VTSVLSYGVRLALVLGHAGVDVPVRVLAHILFSASCVCGGVGDFVLDNVRADGRLEDIGQGVGVLAGSPIGANDRDSRTRHLDNCVVSRCGADASNRRLVAPSESSKFLIFLPLRIVASVCARFRPGTSQTWRRSCRSDGLRDCSGRLMDHFIIERLHSTHILWTCEESASCAGTQLISSPPKRNATNNTAGNAATSSTSD
jgi:hypothetical protein